MANSLYDKGRQKFAEAGINWLTDDIRVVGIDAAAYTVSVANHEFLSDVPVGSRIAAPVSLISKTTTNGACDAADASFLSVAGPSIEALIIYKWTGSEATSPLIAYLDTGTGLPITPNGGDLVATWDNGINKIFRL